MSSPIDHYAWILAGILFLLLEFDILRFKFYFLALGSMSFLTALFSFCFSEFPFIYQVFVFLSLSTVAVYGMQLLPLKWQSSKLMLWNRKNFRD